MEGAGVGGHEAAGRVGGARVQTNISDEVHIDHRVEDGVVDRVVDVPVLVIIVIIITIIIIIIIITWSLSSHRVCTGRNLGQKIHCKNMLTNAICVQDNWINQASN